MEQTADIGAQLVSPATSAMSGGTVAAEGAGAVNSGATSRRKNTACPENGPGPLIDTRPRKGPFFIGNRYRN